MQMSIDIDSELSALWSRLYAAVRELLRHSEASGYHLNHPCLPAGITSVHLDPQENILLTTTDGTTKLIEEFPDDVMYAVYENIASAQSQRLKP